MQLLIQANTSTSLTAFQGPQPAQDSTWVWIIMAAVFLVPALRTRDRKLWMVPVLFVLFAVACKLIPRTTHSYRMSFESSARSIHTEEFVNGKAQQEQMVVLADVASAEMQYNRDATRIALILRNGEQRFPLGPYHFNNEPEQYVVLTKIRSYIGQTASEGK